MLFTYLASYKHYKLMDIRRGYLTCYICH